MSIVWTNEKQTGGYAEFTSSGTLTWAENTPPPEADLFCVGGGGSGGIGSKIGLPKGGGGGGGGYTTTVTGSELGVSTEVTIGAGGAAVTANYNVTGGRNGNPGGETSIGNLCSANGGKGGGGASRAGGAGGSGGGGGAVDTTASGAGGSNGGNGAQSQDGGAGGTGQGTTTADLLGRIHAGGGGGAHNNQAAAGGQSSFSEGKGGNYMNLGGGGGYGGGGAGALAPSNSIMSGYGGQGFAMIAWGSYKEDLGLT